MSTFVLVHGAWHGAWCWERVAPLLAAAGHAVRTPVLTGLGERASLLSPDNSLAEHVRDVAEAIRDLEDCVLVGHSYAGMLITALDVPLRGLIYVDAYLPRDGQSMLDLRPESEALLERVRTRGEGWRMAPPSATDLGVVAVEDRAWVDARMTPMALRCYQEPVRLAGAGPRADRKVYVRSADFPNETFERTFRELQACPDWETVRLRGGHDLMVDSPEELAGVLLERGPVEVASA